MPRRVGKYELGAKLGEGTFGTVKYAVHTETKKPYAIKVLEKEKIQKESMGAQIKKEIAVMKRISHDNVVRLHEVLASKSRIFIVLELVTGGELFDKIVAEGRFDEARARLYFRQLVGGVAYCHSQGVCHRDLKPENLLLDEHGVLKISDFGLSAMYEGEDGVTKETLLHTTCGTPNYVAPEVLRDRGYDGMCADVWSMGVILYVLLAGYLPFDEPTMSALFRRIQHAEYEFPAWFSESAKDLVRRILVADPAKRFKISDVMSHEWFTAGGTAAPLSIGGGGGGGGGGSGGDSSAAIGATPASAATPESASAPEIGELDAAAETAASKYGVVNAFDIINVLGAMSFETALPGLGFRSAPQYTTSTVATTLVATAAAVLGTLAEGVDVKSSEDEVTAAVPTPKGLVGVAVHVLPVTSALNLVRIQRTKGDILSYQRVVFEPLRARLV